MVVALATVPASHAFSHTHVPRQQAGGLRGPASVAPLARPVICAHAWRAYDIALLGSSEYPSRGRAPAPRRADLQAPRVARRSRSAEGQAAAGLRSTPVSSCMHQDRSILTRITIPRFATVRYGYRYVAGC